MSEMQLPEFRNTITLGNLLAALIAFAPAVAVYAHNESRADVAAERVENHGHQIVVLREDISGLKAAVQAIGQSLAIEESRLAQDEEALRALKLDHDIIVRIQTDIVYIRASIERGVNGPIPAGPR